MLYRRATINDVCQIQEIQDEVRKTLPVYFPKASCQTIRKFINDAEKYPEHCMTIIAEKGDKIVGFACCSNNRTFGLLIAYNHAIYIRRDCLCTMEEITVLRNLVRVCHNWSKAMKCSRMIWSIESGEWLTLQKILSCEGAKQVGVCMEYS